MSILPDSLKKILKCLFSSKLIVLCSYAISLERYAIAHAHSKLTSLDQLFPLTKHSLLGSTMLVYQQEDTDHQLLVTGNCTSSLKWYALVQACPPRDWPVRSAMGLQLGHFSFSYQLHPQTRSSERSFSVRWSNSTHFHTRSNRYLYFSRSSNPSHFLDQEESLEEEVNRRGKICLNHVGSKLYSATLRNTSAFTPPPRFSLPGASLYWDYTGHYLSISAYAVRLGTLIKRLRRIPQLKAVQICAEEIGIPRRLFIPFSLELLHWSNKRVDQLRTGKQDFGWASSACFNYWKVKGNLAWYSPHDFLWVTGKVCVLGDACFQVRGIQLGKRSKLEIGGTLAVFNQLWLNSNSNFQAISRYVGLSMEATSSLKARQGFMQLDVFKNSYASKLVFLEGGVISADRFLTPNLNSKQYVQALHPNLGYGRISSTLKKQASYWYLAPSYILYNAITPLLIANPAEVFYYASFITPSTPAPIVRALEAKRPEPSLRGNMSTEQFFKYQRSRYCKSDRTIKVEKISLDLLSDCWNALRSSQIVSLFTRSVFKPFNSALLRKLKDSQAQRGYGLQINTPSNPVNFSLSRDRACSVLFLGLHDDRLLVPESPFLPQIDSAILKISEELRFFPPSQEFLSRGAHRILSLYALEIRPRYKIAREVWCYQKDDFFNMRSFLTLLAPFIGYMPDMVYRFN